MHIGKVEHLCDGHKAFQVGCSASGVPHLRVFQQSRITKWDWNNSPSLPASCPAATSNTVWSVGLLAPLGDGLVNNLDKVLAVMTCLLMGTKVVEADLLLRSPTSCRTRFQELFSLSLCFGALFHSVSLLHSFILTIFPLPAFCCFCVLRANDKNSHSLGLAVNRARVNPPIAAIMGCFVIYSVLKFLNFQLKLLEEYLRGGSTAVELLGKSQRTCSETTAQAGLKEALCNPALSSFPWHFRGVVLTLSWIKKGWPKRSLPAGQHACCFLINKPYVKQLSLVQVFPAHERLSCCDSCCCPSCWEWACLSRGKCQGRLWERKHTPDEEEEEGGDQDFARGHLPKAP